MTTGRRADEGATPAGAARPRRSQQVCPHVALFVLCTAAVASAFCSSGPQATKSWVDAELLLYEIAGVG